MSFKLCFMGMDGSKPVGMPVLARPTSSSPWQEFHTDTDGCVTIPFTQGDPYDFQANVDGVESYPPLPSYGQVIRIGDNFGTPKTYTLPNH